LKSVSSEFKSDQAEEAQAIDACETCRMVCVRSKEKKRRRSSGEAQALEEGARSASYGRSREKKKKLLKRDLLQGRGSSGRPEDSKSAKPCETCRKKKRRSRRARYLEKRKPWKGEAQVQKRKLQ
jgi:hypothetical protein